MGVNCVKQIARHPFPVQTFSLLRVRCPRLALGSFTFVSTLPSTVDFFLFPSGGEAAAWKKGMG